MGWAGRRLKSCTETSPTKSQTLVAALPYLLAFIADHLHNFEIGTLHLVCFEHCLLCNSLACRFLG